MKNSDVDKSRVFTHCNSIDYTPQAVSSLPILKKKTGSIYVTALDIGESLAESLYCFDTLIQCIEGEGEIVIDDKVILLESGQIIIIPAHAQSTLKAKSRLKIISTIIKSAYE